MTPSKAKRESLSLDFLKTILYYDPENGLFRWLVKLNRNMLIGETAGSKSPDGYIRITIERKTYTVSNLAWFYMTGTWPCKQVDHINRKRDDNRWTNLRLATNSQNCANRSLSRRNKYGVMGIRQINGRWQASIGALSSYKYLGSFLTLEEAIVARKRAEAQYYGEFAPVEGQ